MSLVSDWRAAVQEHLATSFPRATVVGGERTEGVSKREKDLICVWFPGWNVIESDTTLAQPTLLIRMFPKKSPLDRRSVPDDPQPLEDAAMELVRAFPRATQVGGFFVANLSCRLTTCVPDYAPENWQVNATLLAYTILEAA